MSEQGYLLIADITGYTAYLSQSELDHAQEILESLLNLLINETRPPLVISRLEGDAVISYALQDSFIQGQTLVEMIENTYVDFRQELERMILNTTCTCNACRNISSLDLKFFVHYGQFSIQNLGNYYELVGTDVNLVHRLTKNTITEKTGLQAYVAYTHTATDALGIVELAAEMATHHEQYEHLGEVMIYVQDMHTVWEREKVQRRVSVTPQEALLTVQFDYPVNQAVLWDYLTKPETRAIATGSESFKITGRSAGRTGQGTVYHCAHGNRVSYQTILNWQPFDEYTTEDTMPPIPGVTSRTTYRLEPTEGGTRLSVICGKGHGSLLGRKLVDLAIPKMGGMIEKGFIELQKRITHDLAAGKIILPAAVDLPEVEIDKSLRSVQSGAEA